MSNIYQQIVDMELQDLETKVSNIQNELIGYNLMLDEVWQYHPSNPDFLNPIKVYDELKKSISNLENNLEDLEIGRAHV